MHRKRSHYFILTLIIIALGLLSRNQLFHSWIPMATGDALYASMCYSGFAFLFPKKTTAFIALLALGFCFSIELSQMIQLEWLQTIRSTRLGALIFGHGFLWTDLIAYSIGVLGMVIPERRFFMKK